MDVKSLMPLLSLIVFSTSPRKLIACALPPFVEGREELARVSSYPPSVLLASCPGRADQAVCGLWSMVHDPSSMAIATIATIVKNEMDLMISQHRLTDRD